MNQYDFLFKFILIGDANVGKTSVLMKFLDNDFKNPYQPTIGVEFGSKIIEVDNSTIKIQIWDTAGEESFRAITRSYYKGAICALLVFDVSKRNSFDNLRKWLDDINEYGHQDIVKMIVGNKSELIDCRQVSTEEAKNFANENDSSYLEVSAKKGKNIDIVFSQLCKTVLERITRNPTKYHLESTGIKTGRKKQRDESIIEGQSRERQSQEASSNNNMKLISNSQKRENINTESNYCSC